MMGSCAFYVAGATASCALYPVGHILHLCGRLKTAHSLRDALLYPLAGGIRHAAYQIASTVAWLVSLTCTVLLLYGVYSLAPSARCNFHTITAIAGVSGLLAAVFLIKAHLIHQQLVSFYKQRTHLIPNPIIATIVVCMCGMVLTMVASLLIVGLEHVMDRDGRVAYIVLALACLTVAALSTHGAGGHLYHIMGTSDASVTPSWRFFQPFQGGVVFVATQGAGWSLFASVVLGMVHVLHSVAGELAAHVPLKWLAAGMVVAQSILGLSVLLFRSPKDCSLPHMLAELPSLGAIVSGTRLAINRAVPLLIVYFPAHLWFLFMVLHFMLPWKIALTLVLGTHVPYFMITLRGKPSLTGCRRWPWFVEYLRQHLGPALEWWMTDCRVMKAFDGELDPNRKYIFTYLPHGMLPAAAGYVAHLKSWAQCLPGINPFVLTATVMHYVPIMRDIGGWTGFREVTRESFRRALDVDKHIIMCPGGQAELVYAAEAWTSKPVVKLCVRHKGFIRLAIEHQAALVPMLNMGEILHFINVGNWPWMQKFTYKRIGFPMPYLLVGWRFTPLPKRIPNITVVGQPVEPLHAASPDGVASQEEIDELHARFYDSVRKLWDQCCQQHPHYKDCTLKFD